MNTYVFDQVLACEDAKELYLYECPVMKFVNKQDLTIPALPVPKRFLKEGSVMWLGDNIVYRWGEESFKVDFSTVVGVNKFHDLADSANKLRLLKARYFFRRDKDVMSEEKAGFRSIVYNTKTKALYVIRPISKLKTRKDGKCYKKVRWYKDIIRISLNVEMLNIELNNFNGKLKDKFEAALEREVRKDVPDAIIETKGIAYKIVSLIIQHRIGKALSGLTNVCLNNLKLLSSFEFTENRFNLLSNIGEDDYNTLDWEQTPKNIMNLKRKSVYKFIPMLKKTHSLRKAISVMMDECYAGIFPKLIFNIDFHSASSGHIKSIAAYKRNTPKAVQHFISQVIGKWEPDDFNTLFIGALDLNRTNAPDNVKNSWIKTIRRFNKPVPWRAWNDVYSMARQLGIRIRPNNFKNLSEVWDFHDQLSAILRRQNRITGGMFDIPDNFKFVGIKYPKSYNGFEFQQILNATGLDEESDYMGHCVHGYKYSCAKGTSIIFSATGPDGKRFTVEYDPNTFTFTQAEGARRDNDGMRNICDRDLINSIFIPYASTLARENTKYSYQSLCSLNKLIQIIRDKVYALEGALSHYSNQPMDSLEEALCKYNYSLEDLIEVGYKLEDGKIKNSLQLIEIVEAIHDKYDLMEGKSINKVAPPEPRRVMRAVLPEIVVAPPAEFELAPVEPNDDIEEPLPF